MSDGEYRPPVTAPGGRGASRNIPGRFDRLRTTPFDDGWGSLDAPVAKIETRAIAEPARTILTTNDSPDIPFDRSINPYRGCEHGCSYCFARPSHAYLDLSPGLDFESRIVFKPNAADLLRSTLRKPGYRCEPIALGSNTDPYQPLERRLRVTRSVLEVLAEFHHPFTIVTKSHLVLRDLDLLEPLAADGLVAAFVSITTLDRTLARRMEPRAPTPHRRLQALRGLSDAGVPAGVFAAPMIPGLNDHELEQILDAAAAAGATTAHYELLRLPHELKSVFTEWLEAHYPARAGRVLGRIRDARGGRLYDSRFGIRSRGKGAYSEMLRQRFEIARRRLGLDREPAALDRSRFRAPSAPGNQLGLFG